MNDQATKSEVKPLPVPTAIKSVAFYRNGVGQCCDRCGTFIKNIARVSLKDGTSLCYGSECINKILNGDTSLAGLWKKNARYLQRLEEWLEILSMPVDQMPVDERGYYNRGIYFVANKEGNAFTCGYRYKGVNGKEYTSPQGSYCFHPTRVDRDKFIFDGSTTFDMRGAARGGCFEPMTFENWQKKCLAEIEAKKAFLRPEIERVSGFLARILAKGLVTSNGQPK